MSLAQITSIPYASSTIVTVAASQPNGTVIRLFANNVQIGTGTLAGGTVNITVSPLVEGDVLQAFVTTQGNLGGNTFVVLPPQGNYSGWQVPDEVDGVPYETYLANGGTPIAEFYNPEILGNITRERNYEKLDDLYNVNFSIAISYQAGQAIVTVVNTEYVGGTALVQFDGGAIATATSKTYTANGTYSVTVFNSTQTKSRTISYVISVPPSAASSSSWGHLYNFQTVAFSQTQAYSLPSTIMGFRIIGFHGSIQNLPVKSSSNPLYSFHEAPVTGLPSGVYTIKFYEFISSSWVEVSSQPLINQPT